MRCPVCSNESQSGSPRTVAGYLGPEFGFDMLVGPVPYSFVGSKLSTEMSEDT